MNQSDSTSSTPHNTASTSALNAGQAKAVTSTARNLLVLAGAGTGKTKTIIERAKYLLRNGVPASHIVILSFTRKSAREIADRIKGEVNTPAAKDLKGQTFHSWCSEMVAAITPPSSQESRFTILDEDDRASCFKIVSADLLKGRGGVSWPAVAGAYSYALNAKCTLTEAIRVKAFSNVPMTPDIAVAIAKMKPHYEAVIQAYIKYKREHGYWDYDDLLARVAKALRSSPKLREAFSEQYSHILVDEAQDTNPLQYDLLSSFYERSHIFCVGDDAQSIYGFRGADFNTIHNFTSTVPDSEALKLTVNYRSTQPILDLANWLLAQSPLHYDKQLQSARKTDDAHKPKLLHWGSEWEEAHHVTNTIIASIHNEGHRWHDNMVISRSLYGLKKVETLCIEKKIPYVIYGGIGLMQAAHIRDVVAALRIVSDWRDELAWMRYLELYPKIGPVTAKKIIGKVIDEDSLDACLEKLRSSAPRPEIADTLIQLATLQTAVVEAVRTAVKCMEPLLSEKYRDNTFKWDDRAKDFKLLEKIAASLGSISELINEYVLDPKLGESVNKRPGEDDDHVTLTTIHSAKGLEAPKVYVLNVSTWAYPTARALQNGDEAVEEERRCLYVAMTRAKDDLYVYRDASSLRVDNGDGVANKAYFLNNLPSDLVDSEVLGEVSRLHLLSNQDRSALFDAEADFDFS